MKRQVLHAVTACALLFGVAAVVVSGAGSAPGEGVGTTAVSASYRTWCRSEITRTERLGHQVRAASRTVRWNRTMVRNAQRHVWHAKRVAPRRSARVWLWRSRTRLAANLRWLHKARVLHADARRGQQRCKDRYEEQVPTDEPSGQPTDEATDGPGDAATDEPTSEPTDEPTDEPGDEPTSEPGDEATGEPSDEPTDEPGGEETGGTDQDAPGDQPSAPTEPAPQQPAPDPVSTGRLQPLCDAGLDQAVCDASDELPAPRAGRSSPLAPVCRATPSLAALCQATTGVAAVPATVGVSAMQPLCDAGLPQDWCDLAAGILPGVDGLTPLPGLGQLDLPDLFELIELLGEANDLR